MLLWVIQKIHSTFYFITPNTYAIIELMKFLDAGLKSENLKDVLSNFWSVHFILCQQFSVSIIYQHQMSNYSTLQEEKLYVCKLISKHLRTGEKIMSDIINNKIKNYYPDDFRNFITSRNPYRRGDFRGMMEVNKSYPKCLPIINQFYFIYKNSRLKEVNIPIDYVKVKKINSEEYPTFKYPYEYLLDDAEDRFYEGANQIFENNRKLSYFLGYIYFSHENMLVSLTMNLQTISSQPVPERPNDEELYRRFEGGSLTQERKKYDDMIKALNIPGYLVVQHLIKTIFKIELKGIKIRQEYLPDLVLPDVERQYEDEYNMELTYEEERMANFFYAENMANENMKIKAIECLRPQIANNVLNTEVWDVLVGKLDLIKRNIQKFSPIPILEFADEIKKYISNNYLR
jgi:hypothetical protein